MPTDATEASGQLAALDSLASGNTDLAQLGTLLAGVKTGVISDLETVATGYPRFAAARTAACGEKAGADCRIEELRQRQP